jgi:UrcA family protein
MLKALFGAVALVVAAGGSALAASAPTPAERTVSTAGLDMADPAQAAVLLTRLRQAATVVCDSYRANSRVTQADVACADRVTYEAVRKLDRPVLTALYQGRSATRLAARR